MATVDYVHHLAFPRLDEAEVATLAGLASICTFEDGECIYPTGRRGVPFYVVEEGGIAIVDESSEESKEVVVHGPGEFTGDVSLLTDRPSIMAAYARGATRAYCVAQAELRRVIQEIPDLSDKLLEAFQTRRIMLERSGFVGVRLFGSLGDPELTLIREFFDKNKVPHTWIDVDEAEGRAAMVSMEIGPDQLPFVACNRGTRSARPTVTRIAECLGLMRKIRAEPYDLVIVGAGPAGLAAGRLWGVGGARDDRPRPLRPRRAGRDQLKDRELHGIPRRAVGCRPGQSGLSPGPEIRRGTGRPGRGPLDDRRERHASPGPRRRPGRPGEDGPHRHGRDLPATADLGWLAMGRRGGLLLLHIGPCPILPIEPGRRRRGREFGRPGGDVPGRSHRGGHPPAPRGRYPQEHVGLPGATDRAARQDRGRPPRRGHHAGGRGAA